MLVCNYCGRNLKNEYETCPGCGSSSFKKVSMKEQYAINTPPKDGYKINTDSYEKLIKLSRFLFWFGMFFVIFPLLIELPFIFVGKEISEVDNHFGLNTILFSVISISIFLIIGLSLVIVGIKQKRKAKKNIDRVNKLAHSGILIKNIPYKLVDSNMIINGEKIYCIKVEYECEVDHKIPLLSDPKYSGIIDEEDNTADLLIDPNDNTNYYIDFEIY
jgi:hypothetical protein